MSPLWQSLKSATQPVEVAVAFTSSDAVSTDPPGACTDEEDAVGAWLRDELSADEMRQVGDDMRLNMLERAFSAVAARLREVGQRWICRAIEDGAVAAPVFTWNDEAWYLAPDDEPLDMRHMMSELRAQPWRCVRRGSKCVLSVSVTPLHVPVHATRERPRLGGMRAVRPLHVISVGIDTVFSSGAPSTSEAELHSSGAPSTSVAVLQNPRLRVHLLRRIAVGRAIVYPTALEAFTPGALHVVDAAVFLNANSEAAHRFYPRKGRWRSLHEMNAISRSRHHGAVAFENGAFDSVYVDMLDVERLDNINYVRYQSFVARVSRAASSVIILDGRYGLERAGASVVPAYVPSSNGLLTWTHVDDGAHLLACGERVRVHPSEYLHPKTLVGYYANALAFEQLQVVSEATPLSSLLARTEVVRVAPHALDVLLMRMTEALGGDRRCYLPCSPESLSWMNVIPSDQAAVALADVAPVRLRQRERIAYILRSLQPLDEMRARLQTEESSVRAATSELQDTVDRERARVRTLQAERVAAASCIPALPEAERASIRAIVQRELDKFVARASEDLESASEDLERHKDLARDLCVRSKRIETAARDTCCVCYERAELLLQCSHPMCSACLLLGAPIDAGSFVCPMCRHRAPLHPGSCARLQPIELTMKPGGAMLSAMRVPAGGRVLVICNVHMMASAAQAVRAVRGDVFVPSMAASMEREDRAQALSAVLSSLDGVASACVVTSVPTRLLCDMSSAFDDAIVLCPQEVQLTMCMQVLGFARRLCIYTYTPEAECVS